MRSDTDLMHTACCMLEKAYAPYSHFCVGAALECEDGTVFTGCNVENAAYGSSICAERTALLKAVSEGQRRFRRIAIAGSGDLPCWPCGACRQMLCEFGVHLEILVGSAQTNQIAKTTLAALLPHSFGQEQLQA